METQNERYIPFKSDNLSDLSSRAEVKRDSSTRRSILDCGRNVTSMVRRMRDKREVAPVRPRTVEVTV